MKLTQSFALKSLALKSFTLIFFTSLSPSLSFAFEMNFFRLPTATTKNALFTKALKTIKSKIKNKTSFTFQKSEPTTLKFAQTYNGIEVLGHETLVHFNLNGEIHDTTEDLFQPNLTTTANFDETQAQKIMSSFLGHSIILSQPLELKIYITPSDKQAHLIYLALTRSLFDPRTNRILPGKKIFLDAHSGQVLLELNRTPHFHDVITAQSTHPNFAFAMFSGSYPENKSGFQTSIYSGDTPSAKRRNSPDGFPYELNFAFYEKVISEDDVQSPLIDRSTLNAYRNSKQIYQFFKSRFNRDSYDGKNSRMLSVVHVGKNFENAFWEDESQAMYYGDGSTPQNGDCGDMTYALDVAAHEVTHAITAHTANLLFAGESGALNESYSDVFAKLIDYHKDDWRLGYRAYHKTATQSASRDLLNPEKFGQPKKNSDPLKISVSQRCSQNNDYCGVHRNSGIPNRAAALIATQMGREKTAQLYYKVLTERLRSTSDFANAKKETQMECSRMFGEKSNECKIVQTAFLEVEM